jgi:hypothetical protein
MTERRIDTGPGQHIRVEQDVSYPTLVTVTQESPDGKSRIYLWATHARELAGLLNEAADEVEAAREKPRKRRTGGKTTTGGMKDRQL